MLPHQRRKRVSWIRTWLVLGSILLTALASACNLPLSTPLTGGTQAAVYTQAAETIIAQLTDAASGSPLPEDTITVSPGVASPTVQPSPTLTATGTASPSPTQTPGSSPTPAETATPAPSEPKASLSEPVWRDDFKDSVNWSLYDDDYVSFEIEDGKLLMWSFSEVSWDSWMITGRKPIDYYLEAVATPLDCEGLDRYGVIFRSDASEGYLYGFSCDGQYSLRIWDGEEFTKLVDWTSSPYILAGSGQTNRLGIWVEGDKFRLYANGYLLAEVQDEKYARGGFGVFIGTGGNEGYHAEMDDIAYWNLP